MNNTVILATILCSLSVDLSAQVAPENKSQSAKFDIVDKNTSMSLTVDMKHIPILLVYDNHIVEMEDTLLLSVERKQYTAEQLARVIGVKPSKIKACRYLKGEGATSNLGHERLQWRVGSGKSIDVSQIKAKRQGCEF